MERFFNTQGPCEPSRHYMLPPLDRLPTLRLLIERGKYLVLHAPRQVGKTTALRAMAKHLLESGRYVAVVLSM
jgi:predicted AAA+ superfamily ATPase